MMKFIKKYPYLRVAYVIGISLIFGFSLGRAFVVVPVLCGRVHYVGLHNSVQLAKWTVDREFGENAFLYSVRGITKKSDQEEYIFKMDVEKGSVIEKKTVVVDLSKSVPEIRLSADCDTNRDL